MKGLPGLVVAGVLGLLAFGTMWAYTSRMTADVGEVEFVGLKQAVAAGTQFGEEHFRSVPVPLAQARALEGYAVRWSLRDTLYGFRANRDFVRDEFVLQEDIRTPAKRPAAARIGKDEVAKGVPVDSRVFVHQLLNPGDLVAFTLPDGSGGHETIGPFEILYLGTRGGEVEDGSDRRAASETILTIRAKMRKPPSPGQQWDGQFDDMAEKLFSRLRATGWQPAEVSLFSNDLAGR